MGRIIVYFIFIYLVYRGIQYLFRIFAAINTGNNPGAAKSKDNASNSAKSKFKDVEEAHYTEIKDEKKKDSQ
jgi:hypothetical protein